MNLFYYISDFIIPILIVYILVTGLAAKIPVYDEFVKGAAEGIHTVLKILPTLVGLMVAVGMLRASGFLELISRNRFSDWSDRIDHDEQHGDSVLHHECIFSDSQSIKDPLDAGGSTSVNSCRHLCQRGVGENGMMHSAQKWTVNIMNKC